MEYSTTVKIRRDSITETLKRNPRQVFVAKWIIDHFKDVWHFRIFNHTLSAYNIEKSYNWHAKCPYQLNDYSVDTIETNV